MRITARGALYTVLCALMRALEGIVLFLEAGLMMAGIEYAAYALAVYGAVYLESDITPVIASVALPGLFLVLVLFSIFRISAGAANRLHRRFARALRMRIFSRADSASDRPDAPKGRQTKKQKRRKGSKL